MNRKVLFHYALPITIIIFACVNVVWHVTNTDGGPDRLYGYPLPYATSAYACSFCNDMAAAPMLIDLTIYSLAVSGTIALLQHLTKPFPTKPWSTTLAWLIAAISLFLHLGFGTVLQDNHWSTWIDLTYTVESRSVKFAPLGL